MNGYKPTNNYSKALSNYESGNRSNVDRRDMLNKLLTIYSGVNNYGIGQKRTNTAKFGREVAAHYKQKGKQPWLVRQGVMPIVYFKKFWENQALKDTLLSKMVYLV